MRTRVLLPLLALGFGLAVQAATPAPAADKVEKPDAGKIAKLITQLGSDDFDDREKASAALDAVGEPALDALRAAVKSTDEEVHKRASTLVAKIERHLESVNILAAKHVHLVYKDTPVQEAVEDFKKKSGFNIALNDPENKLKGRTITLDTGDATFWQAFDQFCGKAGLKEGDALDLTPVGVPVPGPIGVPVAPPVQLPPQRIPVPLPAIRDAVPVPPLAKPEKEAQVPTVREATIRAAAAAPPAVAAPPAPPFVAAPIAVAPGAIGIGVAAPGVAVPPGGLNVVPNDQITLVDGKAENGPTDASSAVRVRALAKADQFGAAPDGELLLALRLSLEPRLQWQILEKVTIKKAVDDQKQELAQTVTDANPVGVGAPLQPGVGAVILPFPGPGVPVAGNGGGIHQEVAVHLKKGDKPAKSLTELSGTISAQLLGEEKAVITVNNILKLKEGDKTAKGGESGVIKIADVTDNGAGQIVVRLELQAPTDIVPANNGMGPINGPWRPRPIRRVPVPVQPAPGAAAVPPGAAIAPLPGVVAAFVVRPGGFNGQNTSGLVLQDDKGAAITQTGSQIQFQSTATPNGVVTQTMMFVLTFQPEKGQEASKLVYLGRKMLSVEIPFTLKDVPLP